MNNELTNFMNENFGTIRSISIDNKPYFVAKDIALCLGYKNTNKAIKDHCKRAKMIWGNDSLGRQQEIKVIPDGDIYRLISRSKLPQADAFESWVFDEVIPQIISTGGYIPVEENDSDALIMAKALKVADATIKRKDEIIAQKDKLISEQKPMVDNYKLLMDTKGTFSMNEVAHFVGIGEYYLFQYLRNIGILFYNDNKDNVPYENVVNKTKFRVVPAIAPDGSAHSVTRVLPSGVDYICKQLKKHGYLEVA